MQNKILLWYGSNINYKKLPDSLNKYSEIFFLKKKKNALNLIKKNIYDLSTFFFYIPSIWSFSLYKIFNKNFFFFFFYSKIYYFFLPLNLFFLSIKFNKNASTLSFLYFYKNNFFLIFLNYFKKCFYAFSKIFFKKLKFKGKGYYIYKNKRNTVALQFGYSHIKRLFFFFTFVKFLSKTSIIIFGLNTLDISKNAFLLKRIRPINIFTSKGVRFNKQIIYKKTGKISNYR